jgi:DNA-binding NarL/FixJ family response regulator/tetratricopeptide (TPR) repeat protein
MEARASSAFVGRVRELDQLQGALQAAATGNGTVALVAGDAGIGKTRLVSELATRARCDGFEVMVGRCLDLVGTELPFQPFVDALRPHVPALPWLAGQTANSQLRVFEDTLALLTGRAEQGPLLMVLEDLHWADSSTLDLVAFLAHNLGESGALLVATYRADDPASGERMGRLREGVRHSGSTLVLDLEPLGDDELATLLAARAETALPTVLTDTIIARAEGNPFYAEELLEVAGDDGAALPRGLRDVLLQRVARLDRQTQGVLRLAAAAGRDVGYPLLRAVAGSPERDVRESLRLAVEHGVLVPEQKTGSFRFRHALLAEAIYATILPGEREELHARLAQELARVETAAGELAPHWAAAGRPAEAFAASIEAAREAEAVFGLAEALAHLERALSLWDSVPDAARLAGCDLVELCSWTAQLASTTGAAPRAIELARRAVALVGENDPLRASRAHERLGTYLAASGDSEAGLTATRRAAELVPSHPPSSERAEVLASLGNRLMLAWRHDESRVISEQALALAREVGARQAEFVALAMIGIDFAYLARGEEGLEHLRSAIRLAEENGDPQDLKRGYVWLTDVLTMLGRVRESARVAAEALDILERFGIDVTGLVTNEIEALVATGEWDEAETISAAAIRAGTTNWPHLRLVHRAELEVGRGDFDDARAHLEAAQPQAAGLLAHGGESYDVVLTELSLWERRWTDADKAVRNGLSRARARDAALIRVQLCAQGLRAQAELAARARAQRESDAVDRSLAQAQKRLAAARRAATEAADVTPNAAAWLAVAEAEHERARGASQPEGWSQAAAAWEELRRPPLAAYCHWRQAEALVAAGAPRIDASIPLQEAYGVAVRLRAQPLLRELELLAERARLGLVSPEAEPPGVKQEIQELLGLTPREADVLSLVARGYTNREIAAALVISVKTAGVHVSHILRKLDAPNRREAAAIAHRVAPRGRNEA